jgi:hypothetical protein
MKHKSVAPHKLFDFTELRLSFVLLHKFGLYFDNERARQSKCAVSENFYICTLGISFMKSNCSPCRTKDGKILTYWD